jgi:hypothetical protein
MQNAKCRMKRRYPLKELILYVVHCKHVMKMRKSVGFFTRGASFFHDQPDAARGGCSCSIPLFHRARIKRINSHGVSVSPSAFICVNLPAPLAHLTMLFHSANAFLFSLVGGTSRGGEDSGRRQNHGWQNHRNGMRWEDGRQVWAGFAARK